MAYTVSSGEGSKTRGQLVSMPSNLFELAKCEPNSLHEIGLATITNRIGFKGGKGQTQKCNTLFGQTEFHPVLTPSFLFFFLSASTAAATYIFTAPTRTTTIITWNLVH